jgi:predicted PurR-regulated permease PerM
MEEGRRTPLWRRSSDAPEGAVLTLARGAGRAVRGVRSWALTGLFVLASVYTLAVARDFLLPLAVGVMTYFLLVPLVRGLKRLRIPEALGAALVLLGLGAALAAAFYALSWPASEWMARAPQSLTRVEQKLRPLAVRLQRLGRTAAEVERITEVGPSPATEVAIKQPGLGTTVYAGAQAFVGDALIVVTFVYFLLASGDSFLRKMMKTLPRLEDRKRAVDIAREMERQISEYLILTAIINVAFGAAVGLALWLMGMPNPLLWGAVAAVTNFIPYLGGFLCLGILTLAAVVTYDSLWWAGAVAAVFFTINTLEGYLITPMIMGRRFTLDPAVLFVGLLFWWYVWGTAGALLAVPMMAAVKIVCERVEPLQPLAVFLGDDPGVSAPGASPTSGSHPDPVA